MKHRLNRRKTIPNGLNKFLLGLLWAFLIVLNTRLPMAAQFINQTQLLPYPISNTSAGGDGAAVSVYDFNKDGWDDLSFSTGSGDMIFLENLQDGTFDFASFSIPNENYGYVYALLWADYDNDGDLDLLVGKRPGRLELWQNNGNMEFTEVGQEVGFEPGIHNYSFAAWADYNHDGCLDLYISKNYVTELGNPNNSSTLYKSMCDGTFEIVTQSAGVSLEPSAAFQPVFADVNGDGWEDLFIAVDRFDWSNELFINNQDGSFTRTTHTSGVQDYFCSMSASVSDFDQDGDLDIYVTNNPNQEGNILYKNNGDAIFSNIGHEMNVDAYLTSWSGLWIDYNNNSWEDLLLCVGPHYLPPTPNQFYVNLNGENFEEQGEEVGLSPFESHSQTAAKGDFNNDGYYDMFINNQDPFKSELLFNVGGSENYLSLELQGTLSNIAGIGTWIRCYAGEKTTVRYTLCGENHGGQNSSRIIFGLGETEQVDSLVLEWNMGTREVYQNPQINQHHHFVEGASLTGSFSLEITGDTLLCPGESVLLDAGIYEAYNWNTGDTSQTIDVNQSGTYWVETVNEFGLTSTSLPVTVFVAPVAETTIESSDISCSGGSDGTISISVSNGAPDTLNWNNGSTETELDSLPSGIYSFTGFDHFGCPIEGAVSLMEPSPLFGQLETIPAICFADSTGRAALSIKGGTPPLYVDWFNQNPDSLPAGSYDVLVTDTNQCSWSTSFTITQPDSISVVLNIIDDTNGEYNGAAAAEISGGSPPYSISWSNGTVDSLSISGLSPGNYFLEITDAHGCFTRLDFLVETNTGLTLFDEHRPWVIAPNPASGYFQLTGCTNQKQLNVTITNSFGVAVRSLEKVKCGHPISTRDLPDGSYFVALQSGDQRRIQRLIILH